MITSLAIVSTADFPSLTVDSGATLVGFINVHVATAQKLAEITLAFIGTYACSWNQSPSGATVYVPSGEEEGTLLDHSISIFHHEKDGPLEVGFHHIPFAIDTANMGGAHLSLLPTTTHYSAARASNLPLSDSNKGIFRAVYKLSCTATWGKAPRLGGGRKHLSTTSPVLVSDSPRTRCRALTVGSAYPTVLSSIRAPGSIPSPHRLATPQRFIETRPRSIRWHATLTRRSCLPGDIVDIAVVVHAPENPVSHVTLELRERSIVRSQDFGVIPLCEAEEGVRLCDPPTRVLAALREECNGKTNAAVWFPLVIPEDAHPTVLNTVIFHLVTTLHIEVHAAASAQPVVVVDGEQQGDAIVGAMVVIDVPISVVAPDIRAGRPAVPILPASAPEPVLKTSPTGVDVGQLPGVFPPLLHGRSTLIYPVRTRETVLRPGDSVFVT
ncbi:hypothetical protein HKX48_001610 [Thoreauomyces humboldtii]|nr:hypothetical protein HKX48_001610 [Thoreauomyces humboldtii]